MKPELIAFDLDGTLLKTDKSLSDENRRALISAAERGALLIPATGRPFCALPPALFELSGIIKYAITGNGCALNAFPGGERLEGTLLKPHCTRAVLESCRGLKVFFECFIDGKGYTDAEYLADPVRCGADAAAVPYLTRTRTPVEDMRGFIEENINRLDAIDIIVPAGEELPDLMQHLRESVPRAYFTSSVHNLIEISDASCGKGNALRRLCERLNVNADAVAAFGDADNDSDMLRFAGRGIAMANASELCRASADMHTLGNNEHGVAHALKILLSEGDELL